MKQATKHTANKQTNTKKTHTVRLSLSKLRNIVVRRTVHRRTHSSTSCVYSCETNQEQCLRDTELKRRRMRKYRDIYVI